MRRTVTVSVSRELHPELFDTLFDENGKIHLKVSASGFFIEAAYLKLKEERGELIDVSLLNELSAIKELIASIKINGFSSAVNETKLKLDSTELM